MSVCSADGCNRKPCALGLCGKHYQRAIKGRPPAKKYPSGILDYATLVELLDYDPDTGIFIRKFRQGMPRALVGELAGNPQSNGYWEIRLCGKTYLAHRLAWFYMKGEWPKGEIDHRDGVRTNNRFENLRDGSKTFNMQNIRQAPKDSRTGFLGVTAHGSGFRAQLKANGVKYNLGTFRTPEEAHEAYLVAKRQLHESCTI